MKTIDQIKDSEAIELGYNSFRDLFLNPKKDMSLHHLNICIEKSMKAYAKQVAEQALKDAADMATTTYQNNHIIRSVSIVVDKQSILDTEIKLP